MAPQHTGSHSLVLRGLLALKLAGAQRLQSPSRPSPAKEASPGVSRAYYATTVTCAQILYGFMWVTHWNTGAESIHSFHRFPRLKAVSSIHMLVSTRAFRSTYAIAARSVQSTASEPTLHLVSCRASASLSFRGTKLLRARSDKVTTSSGAMLALRSVPKLYRSIHLPSRSRMVKPATSCKQN